MNATVLEQIVLEEFKFRLTTREMILELIKTRNDLATDELEKLAKRVAELEGEIEDAARRRGRLYQFIEQHADFKFEDIAPRIHELETTRAGKEQERDQLKAKLAAKTVRASAQDIESWLSSTQSCCRTNPPGRRSRWCSTSSYRSRSKALRRRLPTILP